MKPLLLLHGLMGSREQFENLEKKISEDFQVMSINFSGHGLAEFYFPEFSIQAFAEQVISFLDSKGIEKTNIFGYSIGGYVGVYLAIYFPDRVSKVLTLATKFDWSPSEAENEIKLLDANLLEEKFPDFAQSLIDRHGEKKWKLLLEKTSRLIVGLGDEAPLVETEFSGIENEIRIVVGDRDKLVSIEESLNASQLFKHGSLSVWPNTRHPFESIHQNYLLNEFRCFF